MRLIEVQTLGQMEIPDDWTDEQIKAHIIELRAKALPKAKPLPPMQFKGRVEIDYTEDRENPAIRGDIADIVPRLQEKFPTAYWAKDSWWRIPKADVYALCEALAKSGFEVKIIEAKSSAGNKAPAMTPTPPAEGRSVAGDAAPQTVSGTVEQVFTPQGTASPMRQVKIILPDKKKPTFGCFIHDLFKYFDAAKGAIEAYVTTTTKGDRTFHNIVGLKSILTTKGLVEFDDDGRTPVVRRDREPGKTLF